MFDVYVFHSLGTAPVSMKLDRLTGACACLAAYLFFMPSGMDPAGSEQVTVVMSKPPVTGAYLAKLMIDVATTFLPIIDAFAVVRASLPLLD